MPAPAQYELLSSNDAPDSPTSSRSSLETSGATLRRNASPTNSESDSETDTLLDPTLVPTISATDAEALNARDVRSERSQRAHRSFRQAEAALRRDPRFNPEPPNKLKRFLLIAFVIFLFWLAITLRSKSWRKQVVHASRYSNEFKYRPAASPIITETLIDGRVKLRGALPTPEPTPEVSKRLAAKRKARKAKKALHNKSRGL